VLLTGSGDATGPNLRQLLDVTRRIRSTVVDTFGEGEAYLGSLTAPAVAESDVRTSAEPARRRLPGLVLLAVVVVLFAPMAADASAIVWSGAVALGLLFAPLAVGVWLTFRVLDFPDLTVDASFPAGGAVAATAIVNGWNPWLGVTLAMLVGALLGVLTTLFHLALRINSLLASILTVTAAFTINIRIQGRANLSLLNTNSVYTPFIDPVRRRMIDWFGDTGAQIHRSAATMIVIGTIIVLLCAGMTWLMRTEVGIGVRATGANQQMSRAQGIDTRRYLVGSVALSNAVIALSGALVAQHQGFADVNSGAGLIIAGLAAVIIGEVLFGGHGDSILRALVAASLGMLLYRAAIALAISSNIDLPFLSPLRLAVTDVRLATAAIVALLLAVPRLRERRLRGRPA